MKYKEVDYIDYSFHRGFGVKKIKDKLYLTLNGLGQCEVTSLKNAKEKAEHISKEAQNKDKYKWYIIE